MDESLHDESTTKGEGKPAMSDGEIEPTEKADARTVTIRADIWHELLEIAGRQINPDPENNVTINTKLWDALLQIAGRQIDPKNAEVFWEWGNDFDPYGVFPDLPDELVSVGRIRFARAPGSRVWIEFGDLPEATRKPLYKRAPAAFGF
jgi:hypothetical protein